jgi:outer membrane protein assembly factor BamB
MSVGTAAPAGQNRASDGASPAAGEPRATSAIRLRPLWSRWVYGGRIGDAGIFVGDLDADGHPEVVASSTSIGGDFANDSWFVAKARPSATGPPSYEMVWHSPLSPQVLGALRVAQLDSDPQLEVVVALGAQILVYDGLTRAVQQTISTASPFPIHRLVVANADADASPEFVFCSEYSVYVYGMTGELEYTRRQYCEDIAVGQVDLDPTPEIVVANLTDPGYVIDGVTHAVEWAASQGFGAHVRLGDLDADGRDEIVAASSWMTIRIFDADTRSQAYPFALTPGYIGALQLVDIEGDGPLEIVYGDGAVGAIHVLNGANRKEKWQIANPEYGITEVAIADADEDGVANVVWGASYGTSGPKHLYIADAATLSIQWSSADIGGPFRALDASANVGDAPFAVIAASFTSEGGFGDGLYSFYRPQTGEILYTSPDLTGIGWAGITGIRAAQLDDDAQVEIVVATSDAYTGILVCLDSLTHEEQWRTTLPDDLTVSSLALADVDLDGQLEAVVGVRSWVGVLRAAVSVFDATTGAVEWQSPTVATGSVDLAWLRLAQLDADPQTDIVVGGTNGRVYVLDAVDHTVRSLRPHAVTALETVDIDHDGIAELLVGTSGGNIRRVDAATGVVLETIFTEAAPIDSLVAGDLDGDQVPDYVTASGNAIRVHPGGARRRTWKSGVLAYPPSVVGGRDSLLLANVDGQPGPELIVNLGHAGFTVYTTSP